MNYIYKQLFHEINPASKTYPRVDEKQYGQNPCIGSEFSSLLTLEKEEKGCKENYFLIYSLKRLEPEKL
jgi:hypothetical protein